jgi:hypothetical protein
MCCSLVIVVVIIFVIIIVIVRHSIPELRQTISHRNKSTQNVDDRKAAARGVAHLSPSCAAMLLRSPPAVRDTSIHISVAARNRRGRRCSANEFVHP